MSYCRFGEGDVYVFQCAIDDKYWCQCCSLSPMVNTIFTKGKEHDALFGHIEPCKNCKGMGCPQCQMHGDFKCDTKKEMIEHLKAHVGKCDDVGSAIQQLEREIAEEVE